VGVVRQGVEEPAQVFVQKRVPTDALVELGEFGGRGQFAVDQQPRDLEVGGVLRDGLDRVPAVAQDPRVFTKP
jgi:hypothetical protein